MKEFHLEIENVRDFNLDHIFDCGQCFRWKKEEDGSYTGVITYFFEKDWIKAAVNVDFKEFEGDLGGVIKIKSTSPISKEFWENYLDLQTDYGKIKRSLSRKDKHIRGAIKSGEGIRLLNQDKWETLISFIISANNNIPRIKGCIESLSKNFGESLGEFRGEERFAFPMPESLAELTEDDLGICKLGYRAKYIIDTSKAVADKGIDALFLIEKMDSEKAFKDITSYKGVGPKVAHCILLFALGKRESFPVDVWMSKVMLDIYGLENKKEIETFAKETFGKNRGIAQQYLFYHIREKGI